LTPFKHRHRVDGVLHTEEATGSNPASRTVEAVSERGFDCASDRRPAVSNPAESDADTRSR
jgi:hypothetical protein